jgi:hypothetical protein
MKKIITLTLLILPVLLQGQSMVSIFKLLPPDCTPELNSKQKDTLLKNKEYIIPGGDSIETVKYEFEIDEANKYLKYDYYFTTGQRGFISFEVRKFKKTDGSSLILFSRYSGAPAAFDQTDIYAFKYQNNKLIRITKELLPKETSVNIFLKANTPDSIRKKVETYSSRSYDLSPELKDSIEYKLFFEIINDEIEEYLLGDTVIYKWTGEVFKQDNIINSE